MNYKLYEVFEFIRNGANIKQGIEGGYPITRIETISNGFIDKSRMGYAGISDISKFSEYVLKNGDILMSHINSETHLGKTAIYEAEDNNDIIIHGMNLLCLRPNKRILHPKYIYYYFNSNQFRKKIHKITKKSVNQSSFSVSDLKNLKVNIPDKVEQKKIADILDKAKDLITKRKAQIEALDQLTQSVFLEMFGDPVSNPKGWDVKKLKDIAEIEDGDRGENYPKQHELVSEGILFLSTSNFVNNKLDLSKVTYITKEKFSQLRKGKLRRGDLIVTLRGSIGNIVIFDEEGYDTGFINAQMAILRLKNVNRIFFQQLYTSNSFQLVLKKTQTGSSQPQLPLKNLKELEIIIPPLELQELFAATIQQINLKKELLLKSQVEIQNMFNSLMQQAFKGELFND
ncbi:restriction endonuclease subunit S [Geobacillus stearothermophilus]|uniref:restriction endonuclease subunit S n=1 Tax=Geobacillus stearothermophilus TaxID=1422 RepID=UPI003D1EB814